MIDRRTFLKLAGLGLALAVGSRYGGGRREQNGDRQYDSSNEYSSQGYGIPTITEFVPEQPYVYDKDLYTDKLGIFPGWENEIFDPHYFNWHDIDPRKSDPWYEMRISKLKKRSDIAAVMKTTQPLYFPDIANDTDIMGISLVTDPKLRMEQLLTTLGVETREQYDPATILNDPNVDVQIDYSGRKLIFYAQLRARAMTLLSKYADYLELNKDLSNEQSDLIYEHREKLFYEAKSLGDNYIDGYAKEFAARVCNTYFMLDPSIWPEHLSVGSFKNMPRGSCYRMATLVMHSLSLLSGRAEESPIYAGKNGYTQIKDVGDIPNGESRWSLENLMLWLDTEGSKHGWEEVTGRSYEEYIDMTGNGDYLLSIQTYDSERTKPHHMQILWQNDKSDNRCMWAAEIIDPPISNIYKPVSLTENRHIYGYPTVINDDATNTRIEVQDLVGGGSDSNQIYVKMYRHSIC